MADVKLTALTALASASSDDLLYIVDDPAGTPTSKKITFANLQTSLTGKQDADATLTALAAYNTNGLITQTAADTFTGRTLTAASAKISITNGNGVAGNPTIDLGSVASTNLTDTASIVYTSAIGSTVQAFDSDLSAVAGLSTNGLIARTGAGTASTRTITGTANQISISNGDGVSGNPTISIAANTLVQAIPFIVDGGGSVITTGSKGFIECTFSCTINQVTVLADVSGSIVVDIKKSTYSGFPTTSSIVASAPPTLSSAQKSQDATLTGWTTSITAGDILEYSVTSASTVTRVTVSLKVTKV